MEKKDVKIGRLSLGAMLVLIGVLVLVGIFNGLVAIKLLLKLWPVILIILGLEILCYNFKKNVNIKYDVFAVILMFVILGAVSMFSMFNYYASMIITKNNVSEQIEEALMTDQEVLHMGNIKDIVVENKSEKATIEKVEVQGLDNVRVNAEYKYKNMFRKTSFVEISGNKVLILKDNDRFVDNIKITIYVPEGANVKY